MADSAKRGMLRLNGLAFIEQNNWDVKKSEYLDLVDSLVDRSRHARVGTVSEY
jgi:hypothetical protein